MKELIIVGCGPAGLSAAIYAMRYRLDFEIIGKEIGGTANKAHRVDNYPGCLGMSGMQLCRKFEEHVLNLGVRPRIESVMKISQGFRISGDGKYESRAVIVCTGTQRKILGIEGEKELLGKGVSYCTVCDAPFFKGKEVCVAGSSSHAVQGALMLHEIASKVYMVSDKEIEAEPLYLERLHKSGVEIIQGKIEQILGHDKVDGIRLEGNNKISLDGVFIEEGDVPSLALFDFQVEKDEDRLRVDESMRTSVEGLFAAGDITNASGKWSQIITACAEGAIAAKSAYDFLKK